MAKKTKTCLDSGLTNMNPEPIIPITRYISNSSNHIHQCLPVGNALQIPEGYIHMLELEYGVHNLSHMISEPCNKFWNMII